MKRFPYIQQLDKMDCGPVCLQMISKYFGKNIDISYLRILCDMGKDGVSLYGLKEAANKLGLSASGLKISINELYDNSLFPIIIHWKQEHFVILSNIKKSGNSFVFYIVDPAKGKYKLRVHEFLTFWTTKNDDGLGTCLYIKTTESFLENKTNYTESNSKSNFKILLKFILDYKKSYALIICGICLSLCIQILIPFFSKSIFDYGIGMSSIKLIIVLIASQCLFVIFNIFVTFFRNWISLYIGSKINIQIISNHLSRLLRLRFNYFDRKNSGDLIQRINDNSRIEDFLTSSIVNVTIAITNLIVFQIVFFIFNHWLFFLFDTTIILYILWSIIILKKIKNNDYTRFDLASKTQNYIVQLINGIQDIKLYNSIEKKIFEWKDLRLELFNNNQRFIILKQLQDLGSFFLLSLTTSFIILYSSNLAIKQSMTIGELIAIQYILAQITSPIDSIIQFFRSYNEAKISFRRINEVNDYAPEYEIDKNNQISSFDFSIADIVFNNVSFSYPGTNNRLFLKEINTIIFHNKINAIVGLSGSGKSTFIKLLLKMYSPLFGYIHVGNIPLESIDTSEWRSKIGTVMHDGYIFTDTIINNIVIDGGEIDKNKLKKAIKISNIENYINSLPLGLNTKIGLDGYGLSQGQKQRILIARCVYSDPQIIIFDEATNSLDTINEYQIYKNLKNYLSKKTVIAIAHRLSTIRDADQIIVFDNGEIVETGTHYELLNNKNTYYDLMNRQQILS